MVSSEGDDAGSADATRGKGMGRGKGKCWGKGKGGAKGCGKKGLGQLEVLDRSMRWSTPSIAQYTSTHLAVLMCDDQYKGSVGFEKVSLDMLSSYTSSITCSFLVDDELRCCLQNVHSCVWDLTRMMSHLRCTDVRSYLMHAIRKTAITISDPTRSVSVSMGGSAGLAYVVACFALAIGRTVPSNVALTGMIDADGECGAIGALSVKVTAAAAAGISSIYVPQANKGDVAALDKALDVQIKLVATVYDAINDLLFEEGPQVSDSDSDSSESCTISASKKRRVDDD